MQGYVRHFNPERKFGFISTGDPRVGEFFFHVRSVIGEVSWRDPVEFWLDDSPVAARGLEAVDVKRLD